jgi:hypothetical protein
VVALSLFWTLQSCVYLKMRRLVDGVPEGETWDDFPLEGEEPARIEERVTSDRVDPASGNVPVAREGRAARDHVSFWDTAGSEGAGSLPRLLGLLGGLLWAGLALVAAALAAWKLAGEPGGGLRPETCREAVLQLARKQPAALAGSAAGALLLGALGLGGLLKRVARMAAIEAVYGAKLSLSEVRTFPRRTRGRGVVSVLLLTAAVQLFLAAGFLLGPVVEGALSREEILTLAALAVGLLGAGAFGLGSVAARSDGPEAPGRGAVFLFLANGPATLASAGVTLLAGLLRCMAAFGIVWLTWFFACESLTWLGGSHVGWVRWGLGGRLWPEPEGGLFTAAAALAGIWFLVLFGCAAAYPLSCALRWGAVCALRARQGDEDVALELSEEERAGLSSRRQKAASRAAKVSAFTTRLREKQTKKRQGPPETSAPAAEGVKESSPAAPASGGRGPSFLPP